MADDRRIVFAATGSLGDLNPMIAVGREVRARGWPVILIAAPEYEPNVVAAGLDFAPMAPGWDDVRASLGVEPGVFVDRFSRDYQLFFAGMILPALEVSVAQARPVIATAALVVSHHLSLGAQIAAALEGRPLVMFAVEPFLLLSADDPPSPYPIPWLPLLRRAFGLAATRWAMTATLALHRRGRRRFAAVRQALGLPRTGDYWLRSEVRGAIATICAWSPTLGRIRPDFPTGSVMAGLPTYDDDPQARDDPALERFLDAGPAPIVLTLGAFSSLAPAGAFYPEGVRAARRLGLRVVIAPGAKAGPEILALAAADVFVAGFTPYSRLFPRARLVVHHGGVAACQQGLKSGVPQVSAPLVPDQFDNASRLKALGAAATVPLRRWTARRAEAAMASLLTEGVRKRARKLARITAPEQGVHVAADALERFLGPVSDGDEGPAPTEGLEPPTF